MSFEIPKPKPQPPQWMMRDGDGPAVTIEARERTAQRGDCVWISASKETPIVFLDFLKMQPCQ